MEQLNGKKIKALVVDDTAFMRKALVEILSKDPDMEVIGVAKHGEEALAALETLNPDVVTLDVDMPVMDGITTIKHIMIKSPKPIVMVSGLASQGKVTLEALRLGAVDFFPKPSGTISLNIHEEAEELTRAIKLASMIDPHVIKRVRFPKHQAAKRTTVSPPAGLVVVGAHRGTSSYLIRLLANINPSLPLSIIIAHDISPKVLESYSKELDKLVPWRIIINPDKEPLSAGTCVVTSYEHSWRLNRKKNDEVIMKKRKSGSLDSLFKQAVSQMSGNAIGVILGGTSSEGIEGLKEIREKGCGSYVLAPNLCLYTEATMKAIESEAAEPLYSEQDMWAKINGFGRSLIFKEAKDHIAN